MDENVKLNITPYQTVPTKSRIESWRGIDSSVSVLRNIKRACQPEIEKYDNCLAANKSSPAWCLDLVREVFSTFACD
jgi:hypothetical protein